MTQETYEETFEVGSPARLNARNIRGSMDIQAGEDGVIVVKAVVDLDSGDAEDTQVEITQEEDGGVYAAGKFQRDSFGIFNNIRPCKVHFTIQVPRETYLKTKAVSSSTSVSGLEGKFKIKSVSGEVSLSDLTGDIRTNTVSGKLTGHKLSGAADLDSVSGKIRISESDLAPLRSETVSGSAIIETALEADQDYRFKTVSGAIKLIVPEDTGCIVKGKSISGSFKTSLPATRRGYSRHKWNVKVGDGGPEVAMRSVSGSLYLLTSEDSKAVRPLDANSQKHRREVLEKISNGDLTVDDALLELNGV